MKNPILIYGVPKFQFRMSLAEAKQLQELSAHHYDFTCRCAGQLGGFLYGWINQLTYEETNELIASRRELDILMKICEQPASPEITRLITHLRGAMTFASDVARHWNETYE